MCSMRQSPARRGSPPAATRPRHSPAAAGMELALEQGNRQAGRGPGCALDPNTAGADLMK